MKLLSVATLLLAAPLVSAASLSSFFDPSQATIRGDPVKEHPVNGKNPLEFCDDPENHILQIDHVDLDPNPPKAGQTLNIRASGLLRDTVEDGATVNLVVKWGLITLIQQTVSLCDQIQNVDLECPLEKGDMVLEKQVDLPKQIPPGKYSVLADVYTKDQRQVTCLKSDNIQF